MCCCCSTSGCIDVVVSVLVDVLSVLLLQYWWMY